MSIYRRSIIVAVALVVLSGFSGFPQSVPAAASRHSWGPTSKKKCHYVTKVVHGKKTRVKVCKTVKPQPTPTPSSTPVPTAALPPSAHVIATIPVSRPFQMTFAFGSVWVNRGAVADTGTVTRIDPITNQIVATIKVDSQGGEGITSGFGSIWEVDYDARMVSRIDPQTNTVTARISTGSTSPIGVAVTQDAVWVANHNEPAVEKGASIVKIDPSTNRVIDTILVGGAQGGPSLLLSAAGSLWAYDQVFRHIVRIDPVSDKVIAEIDTSGGATMRPFATDESHIWFGIPGDQGEVQRIDPGTNTTTTALSHDTIARSGLRAIYWLTFGGDALWVSGECGQLACVLKIDPATNAVESGWTLPLVGSLALLYADGSLWVSHGDAVLRLDGGS